MTDEQENKRLRVQFIKHLTYLGGAKEMLIENKIAFKISGFHKCIFKYPYNKNTALLLRQQDGKTTTE